MKKIGSSIRLLWIFAGRQIIASLVAFLAIWHLFLCVNQYVTTSKNQQVLLNFEGTKLEEIFKEQDFPAFRKLLANMKTPNTSWIRFESQKYGLLFTNVVAGRGSDNRFTLIKHSGDLIVNGAYIGSVTTAVDLLDISNAVFDENWLFYLATSLFVALVIAFANISVVRVMGVLDDSMRSILDAKEGATFGTLAAALKARTSTASRRKRKGAYAELLNRFSATVEAVSLMESEVEVGKKNAAIAQMVGLVSHDVRRPFSLLTMGLGMLRRVALEPAKVKDVLAKLTPEITKSIASVDGLLSDLLEVSSSTTTLIQEPSSPVELVREAVGEIFRVYPKASINLRYDFNHHHQVNVHVLKIGRVLSNIFGNAVQAMDYEGEAWFKTKEKGGFVEFCVGNSGSFIEVQNIPKLFSAFYTAKKQGTGLGLAIAEKIVKAHGGTIFCRSEKNAAHPSGYVEFYFTLPTAAGNLIEDRSSLPKHSSDLANALLDFDATTPEVAAASSTNKDEVALEQLVVAEGKKLGRPLKLLLIDDEQIYRSGLVDALSRTTELARIVSCEQAETSDEALTACTVMEFDLVISDIDLGPRSTLNGFDLIEAVRGTANHGVYSNCIISALSNRIVPADSKTAIAKGADTFISKPISRTQLLKLLLQTFKSIQDRKPTDAVETTASSLRPGVAVIEDNVFMLEAWSEALAADSQVFSFSSPEDLIEKMDSDPDFLSSLACVVTDFHFDNSIKYDGLDVGKLVKSRRPGLAVLLSSDGETKDLDLANSIDHVIAKTPATFAALARQYSI